MRSFIAAVAIILLIGKSNLSGESQALDLILPTDNDALFADLGPAFYQYIEREYKGEKSYPWEGGQYGFVRDPVETAAGLVYTRFHEGIDIRCLQRDARGEPLDEVRAIANGQVVHTNPIPGFSNYGRYIVIEHRWDGCSYFSLYGHLSAIAVQTGQEVRRGERIGTMGYTGAGLNQARAHLHLELNLMLSHKFDEWYGVHFKKEPNRNGIYNGINLSGMNIARLYLALRKNPALTIPEFLAGEEVFYKVTLPNSPAFELPKMYPWMVVSQPGPKTESWEVSFTRSSMPVRIEPSEKQVTKPQLTYIVESPADSSLFVQHQIAGRGKKAHFTEGGERLMQLLVYPDE
ncbi:MAG: M23 family metallopeptidase [Verrucomicrobiota bacterium]